MAGNDPPPNLDEDHRDYEDIDLEDFEAAVKELTSGTKSNDGLSRKLHFYKISVYLSITDPDSAAGKKFIRNKVATWLSKVKASHALNGKPIIVSTLDGVPLEVASLPHDGDEFERLVEWKTTKPGSSRNVFLCVTMTMHVNFSALKHSIIDHLKAAEIVMKRNNSLGDKATEMSVIGWFSSLLPDLHLLYLQLLINSKMKRTARQCDQSELDKYGIDKNAPGEIFLTHGSVSGTSKVFGSVTNNRVIVVECPRPQVGFYMRHLQEAIEEAAWSPDLQKIKFVPFAMKNKEANPEVFAKMLVLNSKETSKKNFQILGVSHEWFNLKKHRIMVVAESPGITHIDPTELTGKQGRWRIYCDKENEEKVEKWLEEELVEFCYDHSGDMDFDIPGFEIPRLVSRGSKLPQSQVDDLVAACNEIFSVDDVNSFPELVQKSSSVTQPPQGAWQNRPVVTPTPPANTGQRNLPIPWQIPVPTTPTTMEDSSITKSVADLRAQLAEQKAWREKFEADRAEDLKKQNSMFADIAKLQAEVAAQNTTLGAQNDLLRGLSSGQTTIGESLGRHERNHRKEMKAMMKILMAFDAKLGSDNSGSPGGLTTPPRMVRGNESMETDSDDEEELSDSTSSEYNLKVITKANQLQSSSKSMTRSEQKRSLKTSPAKRTLRAANRKSARLHQQADVTDKNGDRSIGSHDSDPPIITETPQVASNTEDDSL
eukprot:scaffold20799_cov73-Cylindrotheca_fusiformis.AAC.2